MPLALNAAGSTFYPQTLCVLDRHFASSRLNLYPDMSLCVISRSVKMFFRADVKRPVASSQTSFRALLDLRETQLEMDFGQKVSKRRNEKKKGDVYTSARSLYSQPSTKPKPEVFLHHESFANMDIDPACIKETKEEARLPFPNKEVNSISLMQTEPDDRHWGNYVPGHDCKHLVVFDSTQSTEDHDTGKWKEGEYKNQVGVMACLDIAQVLFMSGEKPKTLCACQHGDGEHKKKWEAAKECYKRRKMDKSRCVNITAEDDAKITSVERHCIECRDARTWEYNLAANVSVEHPDGTVAVDENTTPKWDHHFSDYVRVERIVGKKRKGV